MNEFEFAFMTGRWKGVKGAAYNACYEFCKKRGWFMGLSDHGEPIPTERGSKAIKEYKESQNVG